MILDTHTHTHSFEWLGRLFGPEKGEEMEVFLGLSNRVEWCERFMN
jgi:hypothetical protein